MRRWKSKGGWRSIATDPNLLRSTLAKTNGTHRSVLGKKEKARSSLLQQMNGARGDYNSALGNFVRHMTSSCVGGILSQRMALAKEILRFAKASKEKISNDWIIVVGSFMVCASERSGSRCRRHGQVLCIRQGNNGSATWKELTPSVKVHRRALGHRPIRNRA